VRSVPLVRLDDAKIQLTATRTAVAAATVIRPRESRLRDPRRTTVAASARRGICVSAATWRDDTALRGCSQGLITKSVAFSETSLAVSVAPLDAPKNRCIIVAQAWRSAQDLFVVDEQVALV
jgi:hypothetical protein